MISVVVVAASSSARAGLRAILAGDPGLQVIAAVPPGSSAGIGSDGGPPDVLLLEVAGEAGRGLAAEVGGPEDAARSPAVVLLAEVIGAGAVAEALGAGARAVLRWDASPGEILAAVHSAAAGLVSLPPDIAAALIDPSRSTEDGRRRAPATAADAPALTARERDVLTMMAEGLGNKTIARRLGISEHTVKTHVAGVFAKLGVSTRTEAVAVGIRKGVVVL